LAALLQQHQRTVPTFPGRDRKPNLARLAAPGGVLGNDQRMQLVAL